MIIASAITVPPPRNPCSPNPCQNGGTCQSTNTGSFMCVCPPGYVGYCCEMRELFSKKDLLYLLPIIIGTDPCRPNPCQNNGICMASGSSVICSCLTGFSGQRCETRKYL
jgi:Notch-like protein